MVDRDQENLSPPLDHLGRLARPGFCHRSLGLPAMLEADATDRLDYTDKRNVRIAPYVIVAMIIEALRWC